MMITIDYKRPTAQLPLADNVMFRWIYGSCGLIYAMLTALACFLMPISVDEIVRGLPPGTTLEPLTQTILRFKLNWVVSIAMILPILFLGGWALRLLVDGYRNRRHLTGLIPWPRRYWTVTLILLLVLISAAWGQMKLYGRLDADLERFVDSQSVYPSGPYTGQLPFAMILGGLPMATMPFLSCLDRREKVS